MNIILKVSGLITVGILLFYQASKAAIIDSTIFKSETEKRLITQCHDSVKVDALDLLLSFENSDQATTSIKQKIEDIITGLNSKQINEKAKKKQVNMIYKSIHTMLLKKYSEKAFFNDMFTSGEYNCVTASALYAYLFGKFGIDYQIKETPTHVYLIAEPKTDRIMVETTLPSNGVTYFDEKFKREFVMYLLKNKIISQEEFSKTPIDKLFSEYYDKNETIDIYQLAGVQYYNKGIFLFDEIKYTESAISFEKACLLHSTNSFRYSFTAALSNVLNDQLVKKNYQGKILAKYLNINSENSEALVFGEEFFNTVSNEWVVNKPNMDKYKAYYNEFSLFLSDSIDLDTYSQTYYRMLGYYDFSKGDFAASLEKLNYAYIANPENLEIRELIENVGIKYLFTDRQHEAAIDTLEIYFEMFPFLLEKQNYQTYYSYCYLRTIQNYFMLENIKKGNEWLSRFESIMENNSSISVNEPMLESVYSEVSSYYVRKQNYNMALKQIDKGLQYLPNSFILKKRHDDILLYKGISSKSYEEQIVENTISNANEFQDNFDKYFVSCWETVAAEENGKKTTIENSDKIEITASKNKKAEFKIGTDKQSGKWSIRPKSKLLYLVPERDKENYLMFKVLEINANQIKLKLYEKGKFSNTIVTLEKCR